MPHLNFAMHCIVEHGLHEHKDEWDQDSLILTGRSFLRIWCNSHLHRAHCDNISFLLALCEEFEGSGIWVFGYWRIRAIWVYEDSCITFTNTRSKMSWEPMMNFNPVCVCDRCPRFMHFFYIFTIMIFMYEMTKAKLIGHVRQFTCITSIPIWLPLDVTCELQMMHVLLRLVQYATVWHYYIHVLLSITTYICRLETLKGESQTVTAWNIHYI